MKKVVAVICMLTVMSVLGACGEKDTSLIKEGEIAELYTNPDDFKDRTYEFTGQVLQVEKDGDTLYIQAFRDIKNYDDNTIVVYDDKDLSLSNDDYIKVKGTVVGNFKGENAFGAEITAPQIQATSVEKISAAEAITAEKTIDVNQTVTKGAYNATVTKVDFTKDETRIYLTIKNDSGATFDVYADQGKIVQNGKQYDADYSGLYEMISTEIKSGASAEGIIAFPKVEENTFTYSFTGYDAEFNELNFEFQITVQ